MIFKQFAAVTKTTGALGQAEAIVSVTGNVDRQRDKILPGAFAKALAGKQSVPLVFAHSWSDVSQVLGRAQNLTELLPGDSRLPAKFQGAGWGGLKADLRLRRIFRRHPNNQNGSSRNTSQFGVG